MGFLKQEQLIMEVESHCILYDKSNPDHKYKNKIQNVWKEISYVLGEDEEFLKKKWRNLRDTFHAKHRECMLQS
ncbi:hypothetical protein Bhyg_11489 [Pseudolycoriella hygida]|uniref:MADF domain-containing protein n=1 Tax=Pseudolycoriella hygida TaxID=35572 RepID=A0A9Q0MVN4_9DIPT|nr:hypothetical protein Bhyg_11489 [Pseudolycoriella hygida]